MKHRALILALGTLGLATAAIGQLQHTPANPALGVNALGRTPIDVQVYIPSLQCVQLSKEEGINNDRDELYIQYNVKSPQGPDGGRLPRNLAKDSYYEYNIGQANNKDKDYTNEDQVQIGRPVLWTGKLATGQSAEILATLMEQDNGDIKKIKKALDAAIALTEQAFGKEKEAQIALAAAKELSKMIPDIPGHEFVGSFMIRVENSGGRLKTTFLPVSGSMTAAGPNNMPGGIAKQENAQTAQFDLHGDGNSLHYMAIAAARIGPALSKRTYLGNETDRTGEELLAVEVKGGPYAGYYHAGRAQETWAPVSQPRFNWYSNTTLEATTAPPGTNLVHAVRSGSGDRKITWICYREEGARPAYKPTQTYVTLSKETDQCGGKLLAVEGVGGFYHLAAGGKKFVPVPNRRFSWFCDTTREYATGPERTNLVIAKRDPKTREITWECCQEIVSQQPFTKPDDTKVLVATATDQGGAEKIHVFGDGGFYSVGKGQEKWVPISNPRFSWLNETSLEATTAHPDTNLVQVKRNPTSREITWMCYRSAAPTDQYKRPDTTEVFLGTETDQSGEDLVKVVGANGDVPIKKGESKTVPVKDNRFRWWSGKSEEFTTGPKLTNLVKASREKDGRQITWKCYLKR